MLEIFISDFLFKSLLLRNVLEARFEGLIISIPDWCPVTELTINQQGRPFLHQSAHHHHVHDDDEHVGNAVTSIFIQFTDYLFKKGSSWQWVLPRGLSACGLWFVAFLPLNSPQFWHHGTQPTTNKNDFFFSKLEDGLPNLFWNLRVPISVVWVILVNFSKIQVLSSGIVQLW